MAQDSVLYNGLEISEGTYTDEVTTENSLIANQLQFPEIMDAVYNAFPKYSMANMKSALYDLPETSIGDIKVSYPVLGRKEKVLTLTGTKSGSFTSSGTSYIECYEDYGQPTSTWRFPDGSQIYVVSQRTPSANGYTYPVRVVPGINNATFNQAQITDMNKIGHVGNVNPFGSKRGYGNIRYPDWYQNYNTISRVRQEVDGTAASAITWLRAGDEKYWIPGPAWGNNGFVNTMFGGPESGGFMYLQERMAWYGITTMGSNGQPLMFDEDGKPIYAGSGIFEQIPSAMSFDIPVGGTDAKFWIDRVASFKQNSGQMKADISIEGGIGFVAEWTKDMWEYLKDYRVIAASDNPNKNRDLSVGQDVKMFYVLDSWIAVNENPLFSDDALLTQADALTGFPADSYDCVFIDRSKSDGIPTIQKLVKKGRGMVYKTLSGMVDPINPSSVAAANSWDGWAVELLADYNYVVRKPNCVARGFALR